MSLLSRMGFEHASRGDFLDTSLTYADEATVAEAITRVVKLNPEHPILFTDTPRRRRKRARADSPRILVAHGEKPAREVLAKLAQSWGYKVSEASDAG